MAKATEATTQTTTARIPPGVIQRNGCRALGEAQYSRANKKPTISSSTGHLAMSQTLTAVEPIPSSRPTAGDRLDRGQGLGHRQVAGAAADRGLFVRSAVLGLPQRPAAVSLDHPRRDPRRRGLGGRLGGLRAVCGQLRFL